MKDICLRAGIVGIGGYACCHHEAMLELEDEGLLKVQATCDPLADQLSFIRDRLRLASRGVYVAPDFAGLFASPLDLVTVAAPIHLHAMMHRACVENGAACYLEKPPTLNPVELASMIEIDRRAKWRTHVGFHLLHQPERLALKRRMVNGEFGALQRVTFVGAWRRPGSYFQRNSWAGRLTMNGTLLLDSCCANAMSHYVNAALFFAGTDDLYSWASPVSAVAELYRANPIEGTDTVFVRAMLDNGVECRIAATHACEAEYEHREIYEFEHAQVEISVPSLPTITFGDGRVEHPHLPPPSLIDNIRNYLGYLSGAEKRPNIRLEDCEPFVNLNAMLYLAVPRIVSIPRQHLRAMPLPEIESSVVVIEGIEQAQARFVDTGAFPSEAGFPWGQLGGASTIEDLPRLEEALRGIVAAA